MGDYRKLYKYLPLLVILLAPLTFFLIFISRPPVYIVTDPSFGLLYGPDRLRNQGITASWELFRRVIPVPVAESAGSDLVALAVEAAARPNGAVLFPYRYFEGAEVYKERHPDQLVIVVGGKNPDPSGSRQTSQEPLDDESEEESTVAALPFYTSTEAAIDLYRAGLCAAYLAPPGSRVLIFNEGNLYEEQRLAFRDGLRFQGHLEEPIYRDISADYSPYTDIGCVVVVGAAIRFLERNLDIPVILFSWADPAMTPRTVKLIFDDSPWALAPEVLKAFSSDEENHSNSQILLSSKPLLLRDRIDQKDDFRILQRLIKEKY